MHWAVYQKNLHFTSAELYYSISFIAAVHLLLLSVLPTKSAPFEIRSRNPELSVGRTLYERRPEPPQYMLVSLFISLELHLVRRGF